MIEHGGGAGRRQQQGHERALGSRSFFKTAVQTPIARPAASHLDDELPPLWRWWDGARFVGRWARRFLCLVAREPAEFFSVAALAFLTVSGAIAFWFWSGGVA